MTEQAPVYMIVQMTLQDMEAFFQDYVPGVQAHSAKYGVETIVGTPEVDVLEGTYDRNFTVILKFPSKEAQEGWYNDPEYGRLKSIRAGLTDPDKSTLIVAPAFVPPVAA